MCYSTGADLVPGTPGQARHLRERRCRRRRVRRRRRHRNDSSADQFHLDVGQRFVLRLRHDRGGKHGSEQAEHAEHQERTGRAHPPRQLVGHVRNHEHQCPVGERGQTGAEGLHLKSGRTTVLETCAFETVSKKVGFVFGFQV